MPFSFGNLAFSTSTSSAITFGPSRIDIAWDGKSDAKVSFLPVCTDTAATASYAVSVQRVWPSDGQLTVYVPFGTNAVTVATTYFAGDPYYLRYDPLVYPATANSYVYTAFTLGHTVASNGAVLFELNPSNTNYTQRSSIIDGKTTKPMYYSWEMKQTRGTATQVVALGRITRHLPNPYDETGSYGDLVGAQTAYFCNG